MVLIAIKFLSFLITILKAQSEYVVDVLEINCVVNTTNIDMNWWPSQPKRGIYAFSGYANILEDIDTDKAVAHAEIRYSPNGITYILSPYHIPPTTFTSYFDFGYKDFYMDSMVKCCQHPLVWEGKFVSPWKKDRSVCEHCIFPSNNFPSHLRQGYYKMGIFVKGEIEFSYEFLVYLNVD